jgi:conjugative relaxase-like TrwC/TraI family protein
VISVHAIKSGAAGATAQYYLTPRSGCEHELGFRPPPSGVEGPDLRLAIDPDYYLSRTETPGRIVGRWGDDYPPGPLDEKSRMAFLNALYGGVGGERVAKPVYRTIKDGTKRDVRVAAYDITISAPKSVSTLMALAPPEVAAKVVRAHEHAAGEAIALLEALSARAARGHHGDGLRATRIATDGFLAVAFDHTTSRTHDPQLHTHVVVMNLVHGEDGRWSALDSRTLHRQATTASYLYQHLLRAELTKELGVGWTSVEKGVAEIAGIPLKVRRAFSTRRGQIQAALDRIDAATPSGLHGKAKTLAAKAVCLATRPAKTAANPTSLREQWQQRAAALGYDPDQVDALLAELHAPAALDRQAVAAHVLSGDGVTRERPTFDQGTVLRELLAALPPGVGLGREELLAWTRQLLVSDQVVPVVDSDVRTFTTVDMLRVEQRVLTLATRSNHGDGEDSGLAAVSTKVALDHLIGRQVGKGLRPEQRDIAQVLLASGRPVEVISGPAGSGKTCGLAAAVTVWSGRDIPVRGTAVAALTAQGLQDATGAPSVSLTRLLNQPDKHLPQQGVVLVDEAGMIGTRQLHRLLTLAEARACKLVLVGDPAQLPEIEAGGAFAALTRQPFALHLDGHGRQTEAWEQHALHDLRNGRTTSALDAYASNGRLHIASAREELLDQVVQDYLQHRTDQDDPWQVTVLAARRREVTDLNTLIRARLTADGALGRRPLKVVTSDGTRDYRKGDQVLVTRNNHDLQLLNGTRGTVRTVRRDGLVVDLTDGRKVVLEKAWLADGDLDHGYAMTLHKAQGRTVHTSLVLADKTLSQEGGYVGLSRGTHANHLYLDATTEHALRDCDHADSDRPQGDSASDGLRRVLTRSQRQTLARDLLDPAAERDRTRYPDRSEGLSL